METPEITAARNAEEIRGDVLAELAWDPRLSSSDIAVHVHDAIVTLGGSVDTLYKRWAAEEAARRVRGVRAIANEIDVRLPAEMERADDDLARAAIQALEANAMLPAEKLSITVSHGWVTLRGEVEWRFQREDAERGLCRLWGVRGVTNLVTVRTRPTPAELKDNIEQALARSAHIASAIEVKVDRGHVALVGAVRSWPEREEAERIAWQAPGVTEVVNRLTVA